MQGRAVGWDFCPRWRHWAQCKHLDPGLLKHRAVEGGEFLGMVLPCLTVLPMLVAICPQPARCLAAICGCREPVLSSLQCPRHLYGQDSLEMGLLEEQRRMTSILEKGQSLQVLAVPWRSAQALGS